MRGNGECIKFEDCRECADKIYEWIDGEIDKPTLKKVQEQIDHCQGCVGVYDFELAVREIMKRNLEVEMPAGLKEKVLASIRSESS